MTADTLLAFLDGIDAELASRAAPGEKLDLHLLGRSALILGYGVRLMTKDVDVVDVAGSHLLMVAVQLFGKGCSGHQRYGVYLKTVASGLPPLPTGYQKRYSAIPGPWRVIRLWLPEAHDLIVTKLRRFHAGDREDVRILCDTGAVDANTLQERFDLAYAFSDPDDPHVLKAVIHLDLTKEYLDGTRQTL